MTSTRRIAWEREREREIVTRERERMNERERERERIREREKLKEKERDTQGSDKQESFNGSEMIFFAFRFHIVEWGFSSSAARICI